MAAKRSPTDDEEIPDDEEFKIDFGKYIKTLVRQWQWIVACALGLGILAVVVSLLINLVSPSYLAVALVGTAKTVSAVNFGSAITSQSETDLAASATAGAQALYDRAARLQSYLALVQNGSVVEQVLEEVGPKLKTEDRTAAALLRTVSADLAPKSDTIQIMVKYNDPVIAAEIANAWGKAYVQQINDLYGGSASGTSYQATQAETIQAKTTYDNAEKALTDFIATNKIDENKRQIDEITTIITSLRDAQSNVDNQQVQDYSKRLKQAYSDNRQIGLFLDNAVSMRAAVSAGGEPAAISNALAMTMLKTQMYAAFQGATTNQSETSGNNISTSLQIQNLPEALGSSISTVTAAGMVADLDALISSLKTRQAELNTLISSLSSENQNGDYLKNLSISDSLIGKKIEENEQKVRDLNSLVNADSGKLDELTRARDLAWESYKALATKSAEMNVAAQTTGTEVVFASPATPPDRKMVRSGINAVGATGAGLLIGIIVAYAYEFWQNYTEREPEIISQKMFATVKKRFIKDRLNRGRN